MRKKLAVIFALAVVFAAVLVFRPWESQDKDAPRFFDRLPDADLIGKANILELLETMKTTTYHFKIPFREFLTREFILQQSKSFGIDIQEPAFFFANEKDWEVEDFGAMLIVKDSSLVRSGIGRLRKMVDVKDTMVYEQHVYKASGVYFAYGNNWLLIYNGNDFKRTFHDVLFAKKNEIPPNWRKFLNRATFDTSPVVARLASKDLTEIGIASVGFEIANDSTSVTLLTSIKQIDSIAIGLKESGPMFEKQEFTKTTASLHLDVSKLKDRPNDPLVKLLKQLATKVSFPVNDFLSVWGGDVAFRQGGLQSYSEKYVESELDENFNITEVEKYKTIKVPGYSAYLSMNSNYPAFLNRLMTKGILTKPDSRYRVLFSPPMRLEKNKGAMSFHTASYFEKPSTGTENSFMFTSNKTNYTIYIDSLGSHTYYGRLHIPLEHIISSNLVPPNDP